MRRLCTATLVLVVALAFAGAATAAVDIPWSAVTTGPGTGSEASAVNHGVLNLQVCGTGFSGTVTFYQGSVTGKLTATKTLTLTLYTGCSEYYRMNPSSLFRVDYTISAGTLNYVIVEHW